MIVYCQSFSYWHLHDSFSPMHWEYELILLISSSDYAVFIFALCTYDFTSCIPFCFADFQMECLLLSQTRDSAGLDTNDASMYFESATVALETFVITVNPSSQLPQKRCNLSEQSLSLQVLIFQLWEEIFCSISFTQNLRQSEFFKQHLEMKIYQNVKQ